MNPKGGTYAANNFTPPAQARRVVLIKRGYLVPISGKALRIEVKKGHEGWAWHVMPSVVRCRFDEIERAFDFGQPDLWLKDIISEARRRAGAG